MFQPEKVPVIVVDTDDSLITSSFDHSTDGWASPVAMDTGAESSGWSVTHKELSFSSSVLMTSRLAADNDENPSVGTFQQQTRASIIKDPMSSPMDASSSGHLEASTDDSYLSGLRDSPLAPSPSSASSSPARSNCIRSSCVRRLLQAPIHVDASPLPAASTSRHRRQTGGARRADVHVTSTPMTRDVKKADEENSEDGCRQRRRRGLFVQSCPITRRPLAVVNNILETSTTGSRSLRKTASVDSPAVGVEAVGHRQVHFAASSTVLPKCHSEAEASIGSAMMRLDDGGCENLVGDFSRPICLPVIARGKHSDLKAITPDTMARVINNEFSSEIERCTIVDCRYPYEFNGGHIKGAVNIYSKDEIKEVFLAEAASSLATTGETSTTGDFKRRVIVFHCEYSSERGPRLLRFLRNADRALHESCYPALSHPELYLLEGGYRQFQAEHAELCVPVGGYTTMFDERFAADLVRFKAESMVFASADRLRRKAALDASAARRQRRSAPRKNIF